MNEKSAAIAEKGASSFHQLDLLQVLEHQKSESAGVVDQIAFVGGVIWDLTWCPVQFEDCFFLALSPHPSTTPEHEIGARYTEDVVIQFWRVAHDESARFFLFVSVGSHLSSSRMSFGIVLRRAGYISSMVWCPWEVKHYLLNLVFSVSVTNHRAQRDDIGPKKKG